MFELNKAYIADMPAFSRFVKESEKIALSVVCGQNIVFSVDIIFDFFHFSPKQIKQKA